MLKAFLPADKAPSFKDKEESKADIPVLERAYAELLERRIAQLQAQLEAHSQDKRRTPKASKGASGPGHEGNAADRDVDSDKDLFEKRARVRKVVSVWDHETDSRRDYEKFDTAPKPVEDGGTIFRRIMDSEDEKKLVGEELTVESEGLKNLLKGVLQHTPPQQFTAKKVTFHFPFRAFVWQWQRLIDACKPRDGDSQTVREAREDLRDVLALLESSDALGAYFSNQASHEAGGTVTFDYIWTLFPPGTCVYARSFMDEDQLFEVEGSAIQLDGATPSKPNSFTVLARGFDWDGTVFRPYVYTFEVMNFDGTRSITSLPCFPVNFYRAAGDDNGSKLRERLLARGEFFFRLCTVPDFHYEYTGSVLFGTSEPDVAQNDGRPVRRTRASLLEKSKVVVDNYSFLRSRRNRDSGRMLLGERIGKESSVFRACTCDTCRDMTTIDWLRKLDGPRHLTEEEQHEPNQMFKSSQDRLLLCPPKLLGYSLQLKQWCQFAVDCVKPLKRRAVWGFDDSFEQKLEMKEEDKQLLRAMIQNHVSTTKRRVMRDAVEGKGQGLVILLHGPPGVGKTLTAETVALSSGKPLLSVSTAEIGINPEDAEKNLRAIFQDASRWGAVLLIDEADVFLEERKGTRDLQRNALVAVLLRMLEYYEGIIILTTNRILSLDVAVESRIHLGIQYRDLTSDQVQKIFQNFLDDVDDSRIADREAIKREVKRTVRLVKLNGRQIRNIIMTSLLLAESEGSKLKAHHVEAAIDATQSFLGCLRDSTHHKRGLNEAPTD